MVEELLMIGIEDALKPFLEIFIDLKFLLEVFSFQIVPNISYLHFNQSKIIEDILILYL